MFSAIAPRWPRAFTSIGIGAIDLYMILFSFWSGRQLSAAEKGFDLVPLHYQLYLFFKELDGSLLAIVGVFLLFVCYAIGEIAIVATRTVLNTRGRSTKRTSRFAIVAKISNPIVTENYYRYSHNDDLLYGMFGSVILVSVGLVLSRFLSNVATESDIVIAVLGLALSIGVMRLIRAQENQIDNELLAVTEDYLHENSDKRVAT